MEHEGELVVSQLHEDDYRLGSKIKDRISNEMWRTYENN